MSLTLTRADEDSALAPGPITQLRTQLEQRADEFRMVLPAHITPEKLQRTVLTAAQSNPDLLKCDRRSFLTSCMKAAQDGLLPDGREAAIVPFNTRMKVDGEWKWVKLAQYMPMVFGLRKKILQSEEVTDIYAAVVYRQEIEAGKFYYEEGSERKLRHMPLLDLDFRPADADIACVYSCATFANGTQSYEVMRRFEIDEVRESSQTGAEFDAKGEPRDAKGPWVDWFAEMAKKSCIRRHSKSLPQSSDIVADVEADDMAFASRSALQLLEGTKADAPKPVLDEGGTFDDEVHDEDTGELPPKPGAAKPSPEAETVSRKHIVETADDNQPKPEPEVNPRAKPLPKVNNPPEPEPKTESEVKTESEEPEPAKELGHGDLEADAKDYAAAQEADAPEPEDEFLGHEVKSEFERRADDYVSRAKACDLLVDFRKLEREAEMDLAEMPVHLSEIVDTVFEQTRKRLTPRKNNSN